VQHRFTVAEFFCGCGGLSHGFKHSGLFKVVLGNDLKPEALNTFKLNNSSSQGSPAVIRGDIRELALSEIIQQLEQHGVKRGLVDCLIGGPPCQGFSQMRRSEERKHGEIVRFKGYDRLDHDPRNDLVLRFLEIAAALNPKVILIENVPQMLRHGHKGIPGGLRDSVILLLQEMGYQSTVAIINAADYGVPQLRERAIFLASRIGPIALPARTHGDPLSLEVRRGELQPWRTVQDAISDLPFDPPLDRDLLAGTEVSTYRDVPLSAFANCMRTGDVFPPNHVSRKYDERVLSIVRQMKPGETWDDASRRMQAKYEKIIAKHSRPRETQSAVIKRLAEQKLINPTFFKKYYWSAYTRLDWNRPALTITANANFLGSGRFTHPERNRGITMREAARLQSFDDSFEFVTAVSGSNSVPKIGIGLDMIGEAVPPLLGEVFAGRIGTALQEHSANSSSEKNAWPRILAEVSPTVVSL
jgi:DNA (cytosine-5)-methyltransferase 1